MALLLISALMWLTDAKSARIAENPEETMQRVVIAALMFGLWLSGPAAPRR